MSIGGGVTVVVVHEAGIPRFVRILGSGGRLAHRRDRARPRAHVRPGRGGQAADRPGAGPSPSAPAPRWRVRSRTSSSRSAARSTTTARNRLAAAAARHAHRWRVAHAGLVEQLVDLVGLPVELATPREQLAIGDIGFPDRPARRLLDPYLPRRSGSRSAGCPRARIDLLGGEGRRPPSTAAGRSIAAVVGTLLRARAPRDLVGAQERARHREGPPRHGPGARSRAQQGEGEPVGAATHPGRDRDAAGPGGAELAQDVSWARMLQEIARTIPNDTWLTAFQGTAVVPGTSSGTGSTTTPGVTTPTTTAGNLPELQDKARDQRPAATD